MEKESYNEESYNEELIVRYLLGDLPEDEQVRLEDRAFSDDRYMQDILAVECDLIDDYLRGSLSGRRRRQFEDRFLASAERRKKVEFARALAEVSADNAIAGTLPTPPETAAQTTWWDALLRLLSQSGPAIKLSLSAASILLLVGISWLIAQTIRMRGEIERLESERQAQLAREESLVQQIERERAQRQRSEELSRQLEQERERLAGPRSGERAPQSSPAIASLLLLPGVARGAGDRQELVIPKAARLVRLQVGLEREDQYRSFRVELRTAQGQEIWTEDDLRARASRAGRIINVVIPENLFAAGDYELTLEGVTGDRATEVVRYYYFAAVRQ